MSSEDQVSSVEIDMTERRIYNTRSRNRANTLNGASDTSDLDLDIQMQQPLLDDDLDHDRKMGRKNGRDEDKESGPGMCSPSLTQDRSNIALLMFLYVLQGIPLGLGGSVPYLLQSRHVDYKDQAIFSLVYWPFSVKLLWAPIVDAVYFKAFGRRKSWLVPIQYLLGLFMLFLSYHTAELMGEGTPGVGVNVKTLTAVFFMLNFLAATQDIAVDGWALTMLARENVGWASTCNSVGQTAGFFLGYVVFLALESPNFCNDWLRAVPSDVGMITLSGYLYFWGIVFLVTTTLVMILKRETTRGNSTGEEVELGIIDMYKTLYKVVRLPSVQSLMLILLTAKIGFAAADAVSGLKLIEEGVPRDSLALLGIPMVPIQIILPLVISKWTAGPRPLDTFLKAMPYRLLIGLLFMGIVWWAPLTKISEGKYPLYFFLVVLLVYSMHQVTLYSMFVAQMAFFAKVSDPAIGGTYMTLLNTITNFGGNWPSTVGLWLVDILTWKSCEGAAGFCENHDQVKVCEDGGGKCITHIDGYYIESIACVFIGFSWLLWKSKTVRKLQDIPAREWTVIT
jgi:PAT family acetyl-CoA transporter-like MFS transporter 1